MAGTVSSESEGGKTWFALSAVLDEMNRGNHVVYLDFEDDEGGIVGRLLCLGANRDAISDKFHYLRPEDPIGTGVHLGKLLHSGGRTLALGMVSTLVVASVSLVGVLVIA